MSRPVGGQILAVVPGFLSKQFERPCLFVDERGDWLEVYQTSWRVFGTRNITRVTVRDRVCCVCPPMYVA